MRLPGRVRLMTAHGSKGLEFEYVFIMNAVDRKWGSRAHQESIKLPTKIYRGAAETQPPLAMTTMTKAASDDADERNVFYVALTRARKEVVRHDGEGGSEGKEQLPTQFIAALKDNILDATRCDVV